MYIMPGFKKRSSADKKEADHYSVDSKIYLLCLRAGLSWYHTTKMVSNTENIQI